MKIYLSPLRLGLIVLVCGAIGAIVTEVLS